MINGHGGNIHQLARELGCRVNDIIDMSSNVNPLGPIPQLMEHLKAHMDRVACLPPVDARGIRSAFARYHGMNPDLIFAGNGSTQWIYTLPLALSARRALILGPTYADYADACTMHDVEVRYQLASAEHHFKFDLMQTAKMAADSDLVFICNPNNPTGRLLPPTPLAELCRSLPETIFVIDESYLPFVPHSQTYSLMTHRLPNAVIINSMSKIFRLPGLRIGFITVPEKLAQRISAYTLPWAVNGLAVEAVGWLMDNRAIVDRFVTNSIKFITRERDLFFQRLNQASGITCFESGTSYILIRLPDHINAATVWRAMAEKRLLIRDCSNFKGLDSQFIRISLKDSPDNLKAAERLLGLCRSKVI